MFPKSKLHHPSFDAVGLVAKDPLPFRCFPCGSGSSAFPTGSFLHPVWEANFLEQWAKVFLQANHVKTLKEKASSM